VTALRRPAAGAAAHAREIFNVLVEFDEVVLQRRRQLLSQR